MDDYAPDPADEAIAGVTTEFILEEGKRALALVNVFIFFFLSFQCISFSFSSPSFCFRSATFVNRKAPTLVAVTM